MNDYQENSLESKNLKRFLGIAPFLGLNADGTMIDTLSIPLGTS